MLYTAILKAFNESELTCINKYETTKGVRHGLKYLKQYYYVVDSCEEAIGKIMKKIHNASYHKDDAGNSYE